MVVTTLLLGLEALGITPDMTVEQLVTVTVTGLVTVAAVYLVPNRQR